LKPSSAPWSARVDQQICLLLKLPSEKHVAQMLRLGCLSIRRCRAFSSGETQAVGVDEVGEDGGDLAAGVTMRYTLVVAYQRSGLARCLPIR
jgi:hypothetical protein